MEVEGIIADAFLANHPAEAARAIEHHSVPQVADYLSGSVPEHLGAVVAAMDPGVAAAALADIDRELAARIVEQLQPAAASVLLSRFPPDLRQQVLDRMSPGAAGRARIRLQYPPRTAGALLDPECITAAPEQTVAETQQRLHRARLGGQPYLFVTGADGVLLGIVEFGALLTSAPGASLGVIARREFTAIPANAERATILAHPAWTDLLTPPVVDGAGRLIGIMRYETVRQLGGYAARPAAAAAVALDLGELAWSAGITAVGELMDVLGQTPRRSPEATAGG